MSKARLVITAVVIEGRSQSEVARAYGASQSWISRLVKRYRLEGDAAFIPHSRRPHTSPSRLPQPTIDLIVSVREKLASGHRSSGRRNSALQNLVAEVPPPLVAEMLGYSHQVTQRRAELAAQLWSRYVK